MKDRRQHALDAIGNSQTGLQTTELINTSLALRRAAIWGRVDVVATLLAQVGVDPDVSDPKFGETALHCACGKGHLNIVKELVQRGANIEAVAKSGWKPIHFAIESESLSIIQYLEANGAVLDKVAGDWNETCLLIAAQHGNISIFKHLLESPKLSHRLSEANRDGETPLMRAACNGATEIVRLILSLASQEMVAQKSVIGMSFCHYSALSGDDEMIAILDQQRLSVLESIDDGRTIIHFAIEGAFRHGNAQVYQRVLNLITELNDGVPSALSHFTASTPTILQALDGTWNAKINTHSILDKRDHDGTSPLQLIVAVDPFTPTSLAMLRSLVACGQIDLDQSFGMKSRTRTTALISLAQSLVEFPNNENIVIAMQTLIDAGANINNVDSNGATALHHLVQADIGQPQILDVLDVLVEEDGDSPRTRACAKVDIADRTGYTGLGRLFSRGHKLTEDTRSIKLAMRFLELASIELIKTPLPNSKTIFNLAVSIRNDLIVQKLLDTGLSIEERDSTSDRISPIELLCEHGSENDNIVKTFVDRIKDLGVKMNDGFGLLQIAALKGHKNVVCHLLTAGIDIDQKSHTTSSAVCYAVQESHISVVEILLDHNASLERSQTWDSNPLNVVSNVEICGMLHDHRVDWSVRTSAPFPRPPWISIFSTNQASDSTIDWESYILANLTPLHFAAWAGQSDVTNFILGHFTDTFDTEAGLGITPLHLATMSKAIDVVRILLSAGANPNVVYQNSRWTPLHFAACAGSNRIIIELLKHGGDPALTDRDQLTPFLIALQYGHDKASKTLAKAEKNNGGFSSIFLKKHFVVNHKLTSERPVTVYRAQFYLCQSFYRYRKRACCPCSCYSRSSDIKWQTCTLSTAAEKWLCSQWFSKVRVHAFDFSLPKKAVAYCNLSYLSRRPN